MRDSAGHIACSLLDISCPTLGGICARLEAVSEHCGMTATGLLFTKRQASPPLILERTPLYRVTGGQMLHEGCGRSTNSGVSSRI